MRKVMLALVLCLSVVVVAQAGIPITVENPSFEDPDLGVSGKIKGFDGVVPGYTLDVPDWYDDCASGAFNHSGVKTADRQYVRTGNQGANLCPILPVDYDPLPIPHETIVWQLTDKTIVANDIYRLSVWSKYDSVTAGTDVILDVSLFYDDGAGNHIEVASKEYLLSGTVAQACPVEFTVSDVPGSAGKKLGIKFENLTNCADPEAAGGWVHLDDVSLEQVLVYNPRPADKEPDVVVERDIEWDLVDIVTNCDVYFGTDPNMANNPMVINGQTQGKIEIYDPTGNMDNDTTYYWRVDARVGTEFYEGDVWEFTTEPIILEDPCGLTVDAGDPAVFRVKATYGSTYLWIKVDGSNPANNTSSTLTIPNVQKTNEDAYFCRVTNSASVIANSAWVNLMTKRLVALWEFEDDLYAKNDEDVTCWPGAYTDPNSANEPPDPCYVTDPCSIDDGKSLQFAADVFHVRITDSEDFFNFYPQGYTVNVWVKTEQDADYGCIASKQDRGDEWKGWVLNCDDTGKAAHGLRQVFDGSSVVGTSNIADNQWHMVTATYNAETGIGTVYVDGLVENQLVDTENKAPTNVYPVVLGAETVFAENAAYEGLLDKTSIYSYALSPFDVAVLYTDVMGGYLCVGGNPEYDFDENCKVDVLDFADFAADWLRCDLVPDCWP
jgi:concanavalin A-like lectin/glucanase superfamily protein